MGLLELILIAIGLAMDAFAVSICKGLSMKKINKSYAIILAALFGGFQAMMPVGGWFLGSRFAGYITAYDHWIAFGLLAFLGIKMIIDVIREDEDEEEAEEIRIDLKNMLALAVATSIDALAVGITFAFLQVKIVPSVSWIGAITFALSLVGVFIGNVFGSRFKSKATILGGMILIAIGLKILLEHLGIFG